MDQNDTIASIATGLSPSGIGIVRVSGREAISIVNNIFHGADLSSAPTHTIHYGSLYDEKEEIDEVMVLLFRAPKTYTRDDTVEIDCHGNPYIMQRILDIVVRNGARLSEPGEFTKRAFLNGRIDLSEAESVMDLIGAKNEYARKSSLRVLKGSVSKKVSRLREILLGRIAYIEAALDDPEHYDLTDFPKELENDVLKVITEIEEILSQSENGRLLSEGIRTVIVGKPNAGKSSLLNLMLGEERAIVTEIAGTTRDILEEELNLGGILLHIVDTAGIRDSEDTVEKIGIERARSSAQESDLVLFVVDGATALSPEDMEIVSFLKGKETIVILNKSDLYQIVTEQEIREILPNPDSPVLTFSSKEGIGLSELESTIKNVFFKGKVSYNDEIVVTNQRQKSCFEKALHSLKEVLTSIRNGMPEDFYSIDLMDAYTELSKVIGEQVGEDLVNEIFSKFCMGK